MPSIHRIAFTLSLAALTAGAAAQGNYPNKPIRMLIPLAAASAVDNAARVLAARMSENMGQPFVLENIAGAAGMIGAERLAKAAPDGYTIGAFNDSIMTMLPNMHAKMPFDVLKDFDPVSLVGVIEWGLIAANDAPYRNAGDLIAAAMANPGKINYASGGNGSPQHVAMALFASTANISLTHVPYKGATQAATDIAAGQVQVGMQGWARSRRWCAPASCA
ncbi:MAG TPA: tripartite tricarboxylate transporter substrate-binding protein [Burkholderiales bacterium]|nr:tripartite tricarboxylate transporter substrate-binding protein [Burkholderiales bacterium]